MSELEDLKIEAKLRSAMERAPAADFEAWRGRHPDALAHLNPVVTAAYCRRQRVLLRIASVVSAIVIIAATVTWLLMSQERSFAQTVLAINEAKTIKWRIVWYTRAYSADGQRTWIETEPRWERAHLSPNRYRDVRYDSEGSIASVQIEDTSTGKVLHLNMKTKQAMLKSEPSGQFGHGRPFGYIAKILETEPIEFAGQRTMGGIKVNVFRHRRKYPHGQVESTEIWIDAETKQLVGHCTTPGDEFFDPFTAPDRDNPPEDQISKGTIAAVIVRDIVFDAQLDRSLFSLTPPDGFTVVDPPEHQKMSEALMIEWLGLSARANGGTFVELDRGFNFEWHKAIAEKPETDRTEAEQQYLDVAIQHARDGNRAPVRDFAVEFTEPRSFRYLGKGVKLGSDDRIVCFYKLKSTGKYRAVYGDLHVTDIDATELPLPVE